LGLLFIRGIPKPHLENLELCLLVFPFKFMVDSSDSLPPDGAVCLCSFDWLHQNHRFVRSNQIRIVTLCSPSSMAQAYLLGALDCVRDLAFPEEVLWRLLHHGGNGSFRLFSWAEVYVDRTIAKVNGKDLELSHEARIVFSCLVRSAGETVSKKTLQKAIGFYGNSKSRIIDVLISTIRKKLEPILLLQGTEVLKTEWQRGYSLML